MLRICQINADDLLDLIGLKKGFSIGIYQARHHTDCHDCQRWGALGAG